MENDDGLRDARRAVELAEVGPWLDFPASPPWYPTAGGAWAAALVLASSDDSWWADPLRAVLVLLAGAFFWRARTTWGTWPDLRSMPQEFHRPAGVFAIAVGTLATTGALLVGLSTPWVVAPLVGVGTWALLAWYDGAYADASRRTAERLGTTSHVR